MAILPVNMTNPRKLGQIAQIFAEGQLRNQELQVNLLKQKQEQQALSQVAKLYQDETAKATKPDEVMNAFGKTAFGLMKFGSKAQPMMDWLKKDADLRMESLKPKEQKPINLETIDLDVTANPMQYTDQGSALKWVADRNPYTGAIIPDSKRIVPYGTAPGASGIITTKAKTKDDLTKAKNTLANLRADKKFMASYNALGMKTKMQNLNEGNIDALLGYIPSGLRSKFLEFSEAEAVERANTPAQKPEAKQISIKSARSQYGTQADGYSDEELKKFLESNGYTVTK